MKVELPAIADLSTTAGQSATKKCPATEKELLADAEAEEGCAIEKLGQTEEAPPPESTP